MLEKIIYSAIKYDNAIFLGKRHCDCFGVALKGSSKWDNKREVQGFWTNKDRFVNRREARDVAEKAKQLIARASKGNILYSEDIY